MLNEKEELILTAKELKSMYDELNIEIDKNRDTNKMLSLLQQQLKFSYAR